MKSSKDIVQSFLYENKNFFSLVEENKIPALKLKGLIIKYCIVNINSKKDFSVLYERTFFAKINLHNYKVNQTQKTIFKDSKVTNSLCLKKINECINEHNSIPKKLREGMKAGNLRSDMCRKLGINYDNSFSIVPKEEYKNSNITCSEEKELEFFERTHYSGRIITSKMRTILKRFGKLEKYENNLLSNS